MKLGTLPKNPAESGPRFAVYRAAVYEDQIREGNSEVWVCFCAQVRWNLGSAFLESWGTEVLYVTVMTVAPRGLKQPTTSQGSRLLFRSAFPEIGGTPASQLFHWEALRPSR